MTRPHSKIVRLVHWQLSELVFAAGALGVLLAAILYTLSGGDSGEFNLISPETNLQRQILEENVLLHDKLTQILELFKYDLNQERRLGVQDLEILLRRMLSELQEISKNTDFANQILQSINDTLNEGGSTDDQLTLIAEELQDLNCAVHKCQDFSDVSDPYAGILEVVDYIAAFDNVTGVLSLLDTILIRDPLCFHSYGAAVMSHNVYGTCFSRDYTSKYTELKVSFCGETGCYSLNDIPQTTKSTNFCPPNSLLFEQDLTALQPAYYFRSVPFYSLLPNELQIFEYLLEIASIPDNDGLDLIYLSTGDGTCRFSQQGVTLFSTTCVTTTVKHFVPFPQLITRPLITTCKQYLNFVDNIECDSYKAVDPVVYRLLSNFYGEYYLPNVTLNIRDQDLVVPGLIVNVVDQSTTDRRIQFISTENAVNVSFTIDNDQAIASDTICFNK